MTDKIKLYPKILDMQNLTKEEEVRYIRSLVYIFSSLDLKLEDSKGDVTLKIPKDVYNAIMFISEKGSIKLKQGGIYKKSKHEPNKWPKKEELYFERVVTAYDKNINWKEVCKLFPHRTREALRSKLVQIRKKG